MATGAGEGIRTIDPNLGKASSDRISDRPRPGQRDEDHIVTVEWWDRRLRAPATTFIELWNAS